MHSFSWWRMVVRVMECKGGAPLTNEIKIFKHCFTILTGPHTLFLLPTCYVEQTGFYVTRQLCHYSWTTSVSATTERMTWGGNVHFPHFYCTFSTLQLTLPALIITLRTSVMPILSTVSICLPNYILFRLFIAHTLIQPLMISFCTHHVTMKDVGFKITQFTAPSQPIGLLESIMVDQALCDW